MAEYKYDAWGNIIAETGTFAAKNPYNMPGYRYDPETGLYYLLARYYDAENGRFISRDAVQQINLYAYAANNPVMFIDPSGHVLILIIYTVAEVAQISAPYIISWYLANAPTINQLVYHFSDDAFNVISSVWSGFNIFGKGTGKKNVIVTNNVLGKPRVGSAQKLDDYHAFSDIVDNYAGAATKTDLNNVASLYQIEGSLNGVSGRFEG